MSTNYRYVSRKYVHDSTRHVVLGMQQFKPTEFAQQINLNMDNSWGILRCIIDMCKKLKKGKYLIMKDPNKVIYLLYIYNLFNLNIIISIRF